MRERLPRLIGRLLGPLEEQYLSGQPGDNGGADKKLRVAILPALIEGNCTALEQATRWRHLDDCTFAQALDLIRVDILMASPTTPSVFWKRWNGSRKIPQTRAGSTVRCIAAWTLAKPCPLRPSGLVVRPTRSPSNSKSG